VLTTATEGFRDAVSAALARLGNWRRITTGPFAVELGMDDWAVAQNFDSAFLPGQTDAGPADFRAAIVGEDDPLLRRLLPQNLENSYLVVDDGIYLLWIPAPHDVLFVYDFRARHGLMWLSRRTASQWLLSRPLVPLIHAHASGGPWCPMHAGAVGRNGQFLVLTGSSGAGKSTATLACIMAGWDYCGDDFIIVNPGARRVAPLFVSARLRKAGERHFGPLVRSHSVAESSDNGDVGYELRLPRNSFGGEPASGHVSAIVIPRRRGDAPFELVKARPFEIFSAVMPFTVTLVPGLHDVLMPKLFAIARMAPAYFTDTGTDPSAIPAGLERIMAAV
jgi:hypothetical protein